jgi:hypothetical protein
MREHSGQSACVSHPSSWVSNLAADFALSSRKGECVREDPSQRGEKLMPLILWLLGVPGIIVILLWVTGVIGF